MVPEAVKIAQQLIKCFKRGNKVLICGNGGSSTMASHMAAELVNHYLHKISKPLPTIALNDAAVISAIANDRGFEYVFSRQVEAIGRKNDVLIALSTSGKSQNVLNAIKVAKKMQMQIVDFPRGKGRNSGEIQNFQLQLMHEVCEFTEQAFI